MSFFDTLPAKIIGGLEREAVKDRPSMLMGAAKFLVNKARPWAAHESKAIASAGLPWYRKALNMAPNKDAMKKAKGLLMEARNKSFDQGYWDRVGKPLMKLDVNLGEKAKNLTSKVLGKDTASSLWDQKKLVQMAPEGALKGFETGMREVKVPSLFAPVQKASAIAIPIAGTMKVNEMISGKKDMDKNQVTQADLKKTAAMLRSLKDQKNFLEKKARATSILYKQAELGQLAFPRTIDEYEEKVAELISRDLNIVEEAIKLASPNFSSLGSLVTDASPEGSNPREIFQRSLLAEY